MTPPFKLFCFVVTLLVIIAASFKADAAIVSESDAQWQLADGSKVYSNHATEAECWAAYAIKKGELQARTYGQLYLGCQKKNLLRFGPNPPPPPVDCAVSAWSEWSVCENGTQSRTRTIARQPANGGAACPALTESQGCEVAPPAETWTHCADEGQICAFTGTRRVRYGVDGRWSSSRDIVAINGGVSCGNAVFGDPAPYTEKVCELSSVIPTQREPPPPPPATGTASLRWTNNDAYTGIEIFRAPVESGPWAPVATVNPDATQYVVPNLPSGTHWFYVTGSIGSNASAPSNVVSKVIP